MGDKLKNYGIPEKETTMVTEGLIKDISEEKFCFLKKILAWWTYLILDKLNKNELYLDISGKIFLKKTVNHFGRKKKKVNFKGININIIGFSFLLH